MKSHMTKPRCSDRGVSNGFWFQAIFAGRQKWLRRSGELFRAGFSQETVLWVRDHGRIEQGAEPKPCTHEKFPGFVP